MKGTFKERTHKKKDDDKKKRKKEAKAAAAAAAASAAAAAVTTPAPGGISLAAAPCKCWLTHSSYYFNKTFFTLIFFRCRSLSNLRQLIFRFLMYLS